LYHLAREREAGEREKFLAEACGGDEALRREIESLIVDPVTVTTTPELALTQSRGGRGYRAQDRIASSVVVVVIMPDSSLRGVPSRHPAGEGGPGVRGSPHRPETTLCRPQAACKPLPRLVFRNHGRRLQ
jgi:hypothetical protein